MNDRSEQLQVTANPQRAQDTADARERNLAAGKPPYFKIALHTREELLQIIEYETSIGRLPLNLSGSILRNVDLHDIDLSNGNLSETDMSFADLSNANLRAAKLCGASMRGAQLAGTDLSDSEMDSTTDLKNARLNNRTLIGDIRWNSVAVTRIDWDTVDALGDELDIYLKQSRTKYIAACKYAARSYRATFLLLRAQGVLSAASKFHRREQQLERYALLTEGKLLSWLGSYILDLVCGYGERPGRIFATYISVVSIFATLYWGMQLIMPTSSLHLLWYEALVLSLSSFHGRGFFPQSLSLGDPYAIIAAIEAVIGLFVEIILIATFSRRFLGNA